MTIRIPPTNWPEIADALRAQGYRIYCSVQFGRVIVEARRHV